jgi:HlyD family secretion protein
MNIKRWPKWVWVVLAAALLVGGAVWWKTGVSKETEAASFTVRRGPLNITVMEGGSVRAVESQEAKCEVRVGYQGIKILKLVEEGYEVSDDDIRTNKVLVELDASDLQKQIVQQDIQYETAAATLIDAQQNYEIQWNQNLSDIKAAEQKVLFARMDFDKFLGDKITQKIVDQLGLEQLLAREQTNAQARVNALAAEAPKQAEPPGAKPASNSAGLTNVPTLKPGPNETKSPRPAPAAITKADIKPAVLLQTTGSDLVEPLPAKPARDLGQKPPTSVTKPASSTPPADAEPLPELKLEPEVVIDFAKYATLDALGDGEAKQKIRKFDDDLQVAMKEENQARVTLEGTRRLFEKGFVTKIDTEKDEIAYENTRLKVQTAETARALFLKYEFPKTSEESLSKHSEAVRELVRAKKAAVSKIAQAQAKLKSAQGQFNIQTRQRKDLYEQLDKCQITAKRKGLVVYGGAREENVYYGGEERVREGATVRERQSIITIPDMSKMSVRVKIHETYIKKVRKGQKARITVDAYADKVLDGEVTAVGVLPDSQNTWMNPDLKVYLTTVTISGTTDWLKPGMSAKVEIFVNHLDDVIFVPVQAVSPQDGKQVVQIASRTGSETRTVEVGEFNDEFIEIKSGLKVGERVLLKAAESAPSEKKEEEPDKGKQEQKPSPAGPPAGAPPMRKA